MTKPQICVQIDEEIARRLEEIRDKTGMAVSRQIELTLKGFKIVEEREKILGHLFDDEERLAEVQKLWSEGFGTKTALEILHRKKEYIIAVFMKSFFDAFHSQFRRDQAGEET